MPLKYKIALTFIVAWLGSGGPGFSTLFYVQGGGSLLKWPRQCTFCPRHALLPSDWVSLRRADLNSFYSNLRSIAKEGGGRPGDILSGDGRFAYGRFGDKQGIELLQSWMYSLRDLLDRWNTDDEVQSGLEAMGPQAIAKHFDGTPGLRELSLKEIWTYLEIISSCLRQVPPPCQRSALCGDALEHRPKGRDM